MKKKLLLFILFAFSALAQDLPPIVQYTTGIYNAGNQNWMISQDNNGYLYFANNSGLLEYNGTAWNLYPTPNETILRSVKVVEDRIYTGAYMEFGYWKRQPDGALKYFSLSSKIKHKIIDDEQFWNIAYLDHWIIFQSLSQIFIYDCKADSFNIITSDTGMNKVFSVNNTILYQTFSSGLYEVENGKSKLISNAALFAKSKIVNIFGIEDGLLVQTQYDGFYTYKNGEIAKWD
ncbi:MAG: LuxR family transcriptional regulator, partial [Bacteroidota bacterium]